MAAEKEKDREREKRPIRCYSELADKIRDIGAHRGMNMEDVLEKLAGAVIDREHRKVVSEMYATFVVGGEG